MSRKSPRGGPPLVPVEKGRKIINGRVGSPRTDKTAWFVVLMSLWVLCQKPRQYQSHPDHMRSHDAEGLVHWATLMRYGSFYMLRGSLI